jgi:hypothetical protein
MKYKPNVKLVNSTEYLFLERLGGVIMGYLPLNGSPDLQHDRLPDVPDSMTGELEFEPVWNTYPCGCPCHRGQARHIVACCDNRRIYTGDIVKVDGILVGEYKTK